MKKLLSTFLAIALAIGVYAYWPLRASASCGNGFSYCRTVTIDHTKVPNTDQASFPVLVCFNGTTPCNTSVTGLNQSGGGAHVQNSNGYDIIFTTDSACTTQVTAWELEKYVASTGEIIAWVNDGTLSHTADTVFYMCYGKASISTFQSTASNVWDTNYKGVWHLPNGSTLSLIDSTSNGNNGNTVGSPTAGTGQIDGAATLTSSNSDYINVANSASLSMTGGITISAWVKTSQTTNANILNKHDDSYYFALGSGTPGTGRVSLFLLGRNSAWIEGTSNVANGSLHHVVGTFDGTNEVVYVDGLAQKTENHAGSMATSSNSVSIGSRRDASQNALFTNPFNGQIDEVRLSNSARSADWIATEYNNQSSPSTFETYGAEGTATATSPSSHAQAILIKGQKIINKSQVIIN